MDDAHKLVVFQDEQIRRTQYDDEWYFSIVDVVHVLTDSTNSRNYWSMLKKREKEVGIELSTNCVQLKLLSSDGKKYLTDCANTQTLFRIIQSIPSKKAEPFKKWLAQVGAERIDEIENPELAQDRAKEYYLLKGYPKEWVDKRLRGIAIRQELTDEWINRSIRTPDEFALLTNEISKATFGKTVGEYKQFKQLQRKNQNLRDHMTDWELILTMIGEKATTDITQERNAQGFEDCKESANEGGTVARETRTSVEKRTKKSLVSPNNFLVSDNKNP